MKKMLMVATVASMIGQFNMNNIDILLNMGYEVHVACNFRDYSYWHKEQIKEFIKTLKKLGVKYHQIEYGRSPKEVKKILRSFWQLNKLLEKENFKFIHCHTPMAGAISRVCSHRNRVKVIYTAHGFHFYDGAPIQNWLIYYPVEKLLSYWTDILITITKEDYRRARKKLHAGTTIYVPGVGINTEKFNNGIEDVKKIRKELGVDSGLTMLLSVGELSKRNNYEIIIKALAEINNSSIHYFIAGEGELRGGLEDLSSKLGVKPQVHLLGHRNDISELCNAADLFVSPYGQEGYSVVLMEAIACKTPVICSKNRGNAELIKDEARLFDEKNVDDVLRCLRKFCVNRMNTNDVQINESIELNYRKLKQFDLNKVALEIKNPYGDATAWKRLEAMFARKQIEQEFNISEEDIILLSIGELNKNKNHKIVIRSLAKIKENDNCSYHYVIAGDGILRDKLIDEAKECNVKLNILGFRKDVHKLMLAANVFLLPSFREGLNVSLMEAMASGLACIVSDIRGNRDLINGYGGKIVNPKDIDGWTRSINEMKKDICDICGIYNKNRIKSFSIVRVNKYMKSIYSIYDYS